MAQNAALCRKKRLSEMHLRTRTCVPLYEGETEKVGRSVPGEGPSSWLPSTHSAIARRQGHATTGMVPYRQGSLSPSARARPQALASSEVAYTNIDDECGANTPLCRMKLLSEVLSRRRTFVSPYDGETEKAGRRTPTEGPSSWIRPANNAVANQQGQATREVVLCCRESLLRAGEHALKHSCLQE